MKVEKCYKFYFRATIGGYGVVHAINEEEAERSVLSGDYDDIIDTFDMEIEEVTGLEEIDE